MEAVKQHIRQWMTCDKAQTWALRVLVVAAALRVLAAVLSVGG